MKNAQVGWAQVVGIILALVAVIVAVVVYTTIIKTGSKDITSCGSFGLKGQCKPSCSASETESATFSAGCPDNAPICCIQKENG